MHKQIHSSRGISPQLNIEEPWLKEHTLVRDIELKIA
jgi:hypothetical protein